LILKDFYSYVLLPQKWGNHLWFLRAGLWIRIHLNPDPDPDPAFFVNPDPDPNQIRIRIQTEYGSESRTGSKPDPDWEKRLGPDLDPNSNESGSTTLPKGIVSWDFNGLFMILL
jgi:hypothetical protein